MTRDLEAELARAVTGEVRFDPGAKAAYSADASNYRQVPIGVVLPRSVEDIVAATAVCRAHGVPILARGGGTAQNGQSVNVAVVIDCSKYLNRVLEVDPRARRAHVEPGAVCDALRDAAERAWSDLRPRSGDPFALHPRRHDRQQLLRAALGDGRQDGREHRTDRGSDLRRRALLVRADQ